MKFSHHGIARRSIVSPETEIFRAASFRLSHSVALRSSKGRGFGVMAATSGRKYRRSLRLFASRTSHFQRIFPSTKSSFQGIAHRLTESTDMKNCFAASLRDNHAFIPATSCHPNPVLK
jgi:hypothetical protein